MGKRTAEAGPEPPKRPQSGYGQFFAEKRQEISATLLKEGVASAKIMTSSAKRAGEMWKVLGEAEQKPYNEKTEKLMVSYTQKMEAFKRANPDFKKGKKVKKGRKGEAKPPTRPAGAYGTWMADNRPMLTEFVMKKHSVDKGKAFLMLYQEGKPLYDDLPAAEKKQCKEKAEAAKVTWQTALKEWKKNHKEGNIKGGNNNGPKRPLGAYPQWMRENRPMLTEKVMKKHGVDKKKAFLMLYKEGKPFYNALPAAEKKKCEEKAEAAAVKFQSETKEWKEKNKGAKATNGADEDAEEKSPDEDDQEAMRKRKTEEETAKAAEAEAAAKAARKKMRQEERQVAAEAAELEAAELVKSERKLLKKKQQHEAQQAAAAAVAAEEEVEKGEAKAKRKREKMDATQAAATAAEREEEEEKIMRKRRKREAREATAAADEGIVAADAEAAGAEAKAVRKKQRKEPR